MRAEGLVAICATAALRILRVLVEHLGMAEPERVRPQLHSQVSSHDLDGAPDHPLQERSAGKQFLIRVGLPLVPGIIRKDPQRGPVSSAAQAP
jgi:hypothetical protein